ncbi:MAG: hypothetical protein CMA45_05385, partial [Euryarchaeota archaeon]|nr:hypothetical protein [Euryarchaeota archaeon]
MTNTIVIAELNKGSIHSTTKELVSAAQLLGDSCTVVVPCTDSSVADSISSTSGVAKVIVAKSEIFASYDASGWASAIDSVTPEGTIITSASPQSKDLAARLAARRKLSVVQDVVSIQDGQLTSPVYSGKAMQTVSVSGNTVVSVRQNVFDSSPDGGSAEVSIIDASGNVATAVKELISRASQRLDVSEANIIISGGRGMGSPDNFSHLEQIADTLGAAVGASRAAVDTWD